MLRKILLTLLLSCPLLAEMTLQEKVGQLLIAHFPGDAVNEMARSLVVDTKVGGIIYYKWSNELSSPEQVQTLSRELQKLGQIPLLIGIDQEGGQVNRLSSGFTLFPSNRAVGYAGNVELAHSMGHIVASELSAVGINLNFAPVVDVASTKPSAIGIRSLSTDPAKVTDLAEAIVQGYKNEGIIPCLKHFPGLGECEVDSHESLPVLHKTSEQITTRELLPYFKLARDVDCIMVGHVLVPAFDKERCATLSPPLLQELLRKKIGFDGVIITDSLVMESFLKCCSSIEEGAIQAINAGCDMLLLGGRHLQGTTTRELMPEDVQHIANSIVHAVETGRITQERLDESVERILKLKKRAGLYETREHLLSEIKTEEHTLVAEMLTKSGIQVVKNGAITYNPHLKSVVCFVPLALKEFYETTRLHNHRVIYYDHLGTHLPHLPTSEIVIIFTYNAWSSAQARAYVNRIMSLAEWRDTVVIPLADPFDATLFPCATTILNTHSPTAASLDAALLTLEECSPPHFR